MTKMKNIFPFLFAVCFLFSCQSKESIDSKELFIDWAVYDSVSDIKDVAECAVICEVVTKNECISTVYTPDEFEKEASKLEDGESAGNKLRNNIVTPCTVKVTDVVYGDVDEGNIKVYQLGGRIGNIELVEKYTMYLSEGTKYVYS